jgi:hypothetical protein
VASGLSQHLDEDVGCAIHHLRLIDEPVHRVHVPGDAHAAHHAVEIAVQSHAQLRQDVQSAEPRRLLAVLEVERPAELPDETPLAVPLTELTGHENQVSRPDEGNIVRPGLARLWEFDPELLQPLLDSHSLRLLSAS